VSAPEIRLLELRNTYKWGGGPDKTILLSAERHNRARVKAVVAYIRSDDDSEFRVGERAAGRVDFYDIRERAKLDPRVFAVIRKIIIDHDINVVHGHDYKSDLFAYVVRRWMWRRRIALLSTAHAWVMLDARGQLYRKLDLFLMKRFDHLIAVSHATKAEMVEAGVSPEMITVVHNAIDTDAWDRGRAAGDLRDELGLSGAFPVVGYVGRIMPEKDLETWLRAAAVLARGHAGARFVLVGDGRDDGTRAGLERLAAELGIADRVIFTGYRSDLLAVYATFDMFLLTSRREGLPNSLLEAMAMGLPVVTTDVAGAKELVVDRKTGFVLPQGDVDGIAAALGALTADERLRRDMSAAGRARIEQDFSFARRLERIEELYERIVVSQPGSARASAVGESVGATSRKFR
jgi:glycosyltransferase involved in cell wall biosynthesis